MNLDRLFIENGSEIPFCARRRCWPIRAYFHFQDVILTPGQVQNYHERGIHQATFWGEYHNGLRVTQYQQQYGTDADDWELVRF